METMLINCAACGERVSLSARTCPKCGHPVTAAQRAQASQLLYSGRQRVGHGMGKAGLGCGIPGLIFFWLPFVGPPLIILSFLFSVLGVALGKNKGAAVTGLVFSILGILAMTIMLSAVGSLYNIGAANSFADDYNDDLISDPAFQMQMQQELDQAMQEAMQEAQQAQPAQ